MYTLYDNVLTEEEHILCYNNLRFGTNWEFSQVSSKEKEDGFYFWYNELSNNQFYNQTFFSRIKKITGKEFSLKAVYANGQTYGLSGDLHVDSNDDSSYTFLYYVNPYWDVRWGGATIIYTDADKYTSITPKPNTAIMFKGNTLHAGMEPTRHCKELRITIAFKLTCLEK